MNTATRLACLAMGAGLPALPSTAVARTDLDTGVTPPVIAEMVTDEELASVRGKYLGSSLVSGFMVEMVSRWQNDSAIATATARVAAANLAAGNAIAQATADVSARVQSLNETLGVGAVAGNGGVARSDIQVGGVGQIAQIAGDGNSAANVGAISTQTAPLAALPTAAGAGTSGPIAQVAQGSGMTASASVSPSGGISLAIQSPAGTASQIAHAGSLMQIARITGDAQQVMNRTNITLQVQPMTLRQLTQNSMRDALAAIATMRR